MKISDTSPDLIGELFILPVSITFSITFKDEEPYNQQHSCDEQQTSNNSA